MQIPSSSSGFPSYSKPEVKIELVGKAFRGGEPGFDTCLVGAVGSCLGGSVLVGRLAGVVVFGDIDP